MKPTRLLSGNGERSPLLLLATLYPLLLVVCEGLVPALKGSAVGLNGLIHYADLASDVLSHFGALALLLLGVPSLVPSLLEQGTRWSGLVLLPASLFAYLVLIGASHGPLATELVAAAALGSGLGGATLFAVRGKRSTADLPLVYASLSCASSGALELISESQPRLGTALGAFAMLMALLTSLELVLCLVRHRQAKSLHVAMVVVAYPVGAALSAGHANSPFLAWLARALNILVENGNVPPAVGGALTLAALVAVSRGRSGGTASVTIAACASLLTVLPPSPLSIGLLGTMLLRSSADIESKRAGSALIHPG